MSDSRLRSLGKAFSWRIVATLTTAVIAYVVTGEPAVAVTIGSIEFVLKFFIYYVHERAWAVLPGRRSRQAVQVSPRIKSFKPRLERISIQ